MKKNQITTIDLRKVLIIFSFIFLLISFFLSLKNKEKPEEIIDEKNNENIEEKIEENLEKRIEEEVERRLNLLLEEKARIEEKYEEISFLIQDEMKYEIDFFKVFYETGRRREDISSDVQFKSYKPHIQDLRGILMDHYFDFLKGLLVQKKYKEAYDIFIDGKNVSYQRFVSTFSKVDEESYIRVDDLKRFEEVLSFKLLLMKVDGFYQELSVEIVVDKDVVFKF
jgi:hypothetical protein